MAGQLWIWGDNGSGLLGDNTTTSKSSPVQTTAGGSNWSNGSFGGLCAAAIKTDGTLWTWGSGNNGYLGDNTTVGKSSPVQTVTGGNNWSIVSCGYRHVAAIKTDGTLWLWGKQGGIGGGNNGGLGDNTTVSKSSPVQTVTGGNNWSNVSIGFSYSAAIKTDGTLWLWGRNNYGQLGDNTLIHRSSPVQTIAGGNNWNFVACGNYQTAAIKTDGTLWTWGGNNAGQLGDNTITHRSSPVQTIAAGNNWTKISCLKNQTAAIKSDGTLWLWGSNGNGELGDNTVISKSSPIQTITRGTNWSQVACGNQYTAATKTDGTLWLWGLNTAGKLGDNTTTSKSSPIQTTTFGNRWSIVGTGYYSTLAIYENTPSALSIATQPANAYTGQKLLNQPVINVVDSSGAIVQTPPILISVALASGSPTLTGNTNILSSGGVVSYSDLALTGIGSGSLIFTASGLTSAISSYVAVEQSSIAIVPKRTETSGRIPDPTQLRNGELAINIADKKGYVKNSSGAIVNVFTGLGDSTITSGMVAENAINMREIAPGAVGPSELASGVIGGSNSQILYNSSGAIIGTAALTLSTTSGVVTIAPQNAGYNALTLRSYTSQTADLLKVQNSAGTDIARVTSSGEWVGPLGSGNIVSGYIASGQIGINHLASGVISTAVLGSGQVTSGSIASGSVGQFKLSSGAVNSGHIGNAAVVSGSIASGSISNFHLASGAVTSGEIGNAAVVSGSIASGSVGTFHIASGSITSDLIASGAIINADVADNTVTSGKIASGTIGTLHISSGGVQNVNLASGAVLSGNIASGQIGNFHIASGAVTSGEIGNAAVVSGSIASGSIGTVHLASGTISAAGTQGQVQFNASGAFTGASGLVYSATSPNFTVTAQNAAHTALVVKGSLNQTSDLLQIQNSSGGIPFSFAVSGQPTMKISNNTSGTITMRMLDDTYSTLSFEGTAGQLFSINNNLASGIIFSVNDISGIPLIDANADATVRMVQYAGNVGLGVATPSGKLHVKTGVSSGKALVVQGFTGQTANLTEWQNVSGTVFAAVDANGRFLAQASGNNGGFSFVNDGASDTGMFSSGDGSLYFNTNNSRILTLGTHPTVTGNSLTVSTAGISSADSFRVITGATTNFISDWLGNAGVNTANPSGRLHVEVGNASRIGVIVRGFTSQTANLQEWQNSANFAVAYVNSSGSLYVTSGDIYVNGITLGKGGNNSQTNTAIGTLSLSSNTSGSNNTALGYLAGISNTTGNENTAVGSQALKDNVGSNGQTAVGYLTLGSNSTGYNNTALGNSALRLGTAAYNNVAVGSLAFFNHNTGESVAIGYESARYQADGATALTGGYRSIYIGATTKGFNNSDTNTIVIGYGSIGQGANTTVIGNTNTTSGTIFGSINFPLGVRVSTLSGVLQASISSGGVIFGTLASGIVNSGHIGNAAVVSGSIASGSIGQFALSSGAVNSGHIGNNAVVSGSIASGSVGTFHIASGSITADLIASGAIINADVADNAVTSGKIASGSIGTLHISSGGVQNVNIASGAVLSGNIASGQIGQFHHASGSVTSGHIGNAAVVSGSIASGTIGLFHFASGQVAAGGANSQVQYNSSGALTGASAMSYSTTSGHVTITATSGGYTPLIIKGTTSQTADVMQIQTSTGYTPFAFNVSGQATMTMTNSLGVPISMRLLDDTYGTVSWEGSLGQLFSISNNMTGIIFSVNDISGIPSIDVNSDGTVRLAQYAGNVGIRKATPSGLLDVGGDAIINGLTVGRGSNNSGDITNTSVGFSAHKGVYSGTYNVAIGWNALAIASGTGVAPQGLTAIGAGAMGAATTAYNSTAVGTYAGYAMNSAYNTALGMESLYGTGGLFNTAVGHRTMYATAGTSRDNVAVGYESLRLNTGGSYNVALGVNAAYTATTAGNVVAVGYQALYNNTASGNVAVGYQASYGNTTGFRNISIGYQAGFSNTTGSGNIAIGFQALYTPTTGGNNIGIGELTLYANTTGYHNVAIGVNTMTANTIGAANTAVGQDTLVSNTRGDLNCAFGRQALFTNRSGSSNCAFGSTALRQNSLGDNNTAIGTGALYNNTTSANTGVGASALYTNTTGSGNIAVGYTALYNNDSGNGNTAIGHEAGYSTITNSVVAVGFQAMRANTTGYGTAIGYQAMLSNTTGIANTAVARNALYSNTVGAENTAVGYAALFSNISGSSNCAFGSNTLYYNTASENTGYGYYALNANTTGTSNTGIGNYAGRYFSTGNYNTSLGSYALYGNFGTSTGNHNVALGYLSQRNATTATNNTAVGNGSLYTNQSGNNMVAVGYEALYNTTSTGGNTAVGYRAATTLTTGYANTVVGHQALYSANTGYRNAVVGHQASYSVTSGYANVVMGWTAAYSTTGGSANTVLGDEAFYYNTTGSSNVVIGADAAIYMSGGVSQLQTAANSIYIGANTRGFSNSDSNSIVIGYQTTGQGANTTVIGNSSTVSGTIYGNINFPIGIRVNTGSSTQKGIVVQGAASQTANLQEWQNNTGTNLAYMDSAGNFYAVSKSFYIDHPTKPGKKLRHVCVEAPSADVYFRGKSNSNIIDLPDYWSGLVDFDTITVMLTPVGKKQDLFFEKIEDNKVYVGGDENPSFNFVIFGERKDIDKVIVED